THAATSRSLVRRLMRIVQRLFCWVPPAVTTLTALRAASSGRRRLEGLEVRNQVVDVGVREMRHETVLVTTTALGVGEPLVQGLGAAVVHVVLTNGQAHEGWHVEHLASADIYGLVVGHGAAAVAVGTGDAGVVEDQPPPFDSHRVA